MSSDLEKDRGMHDIDLEKEAHVRVITDFESDEAGRQVTQFNGVISGLSVFAKMRKVEQTLDKKFGVESHGPDRVLPEARNNPPSQWVMFALWGSCTMNLSCFATGFLGWILSLNLMQAILCVIFGTLLGGAVTGWCATLGPATGLRQMSISRYSLGWWPTKVIAVVNAIEQLGWAAAGCITGGLALNAVSDGNVSLIVGEVIIVVCGVVLSFIGLRCVLKYEQWAWIVFLIIFLVMYGEVGPKADTDNSNFSSGATLAGNCLSLIAIVYGSTASWCTVVSDYYVQFPANTPKVRIFTYTMLGVSIPTCIGMVLGAVVGSTLYVNDDWAAEYDNGLGYLIQAFLFPLGFAKFILVLLVLSGIGMSCVSIYSSALSMQQVSRELQAIPRIIWTVLIFAVILALGIAGRDQLLPYLQNFLSLLGYINTAYFAILFSEHYLFRKGDVANYNLEAWNTRALMPVGYAGGTAFCFGVVGFVLGMVQTDYAGVIAKKIGDDGGDIGNELALVFTLVAYIPLRYLELKHVGR